MTDHSNAVYTAKELKQGPDGDVSLFGAFPCSSIIRFTLSVSGDLTAVQSAVMVIHADGWDRPETVYRELPLSPAEGGFAVTIDLSDLCKKADLDDNGLFYYHYRLDTDHGRFFFGGESPIDLCEINGYDN